MNEAYEVAEVARLLNVPSGVLWGKVWSQEVPSMLVGGKRLIPASVVRQLLDQNEAQDGADLVSLSEASRELGLSQMRVCQMAKAGQIPSVLIGRRRFIIRQPKEAVSV